MKSIATFLFVAGTVCCVVGNVRAQDAAAPFRRIYPSSTPEATAKPTPTPAPKPAATPTPKPRPSPTAAATPTAAPVKEAKPTPTPTPEAATPSPTARPSPSRAEEEKPAGKIRREKPVRAVEPRQPWIRRIPAEKKDGPPASKPTFDLSGGASWMTNGTIRAMENKWQSAVKAHDVDALDKLLDDDFVATSASGKKASKSRLLRELREDKNVYRSAQIRGTSVRIVRPGVAEITGTITESGTKENGERFNNTRRFRDTWKERDGRWVATASEVTAVPKR
jgi:outer membrane biosynthesis protein TonB